MEIQKGDTVRFLNDTGGGIVTLVEKKIVHVKIDDGFVVPVSKEEIIVIRDIKEAENTSNEIIKENLISKQIIESNDEIEEPYENDYINDENEINICAAFVPDKNSSDKIDVYLINDSNFDLLFNVLALWENQWASIEAGKLEANTKIHLTAFMRSDLNTISAIMLQGILYKKGIYTPFETIDETIKLKPSRFFKQNSFIENDYFDDDAIIIDFLDETLEEDENEELTIDEIKELLKEKQEVKEPEIKVTAKNDKKDVVEIIEVDLHIEKLIENYIGMSNSEILIHQMSFFRQKLEGAIQKNAKKIVFIHGVGNGTLKHEIRKNLTEFYPDLKYQDASFMEYGYGATLVFLK